MARARRSLSLALVAAALAGVAGVAACRRAPSTTQGAALRDEVAGRARSVRLPELSLRVVEVGEAAARARSTLVVVHGGLGLDHTYLRPWLDALAVDGRRVLYVDLRGHGRSELPPDGGGYALAPAAADLAALIEREVPGRSADVLAHDTGAAVALQLAVQRPERVRRLVLVAPLLEGRALRALDARLDALLGAERAAQARALRTPQGTLRDARTLLAHLRWTAPLWFAAPPDDAVLRRFARDCAYRDEAEAHMRVALAAFDAEALGAEARAATLVLVGASDRVLAVRDARGLANALPHGQLAVLEASAHVPFAEQPARFVAAVEPFLREPGAAAEGADRR